MRAAIAAADAGRLLDRALTDPSISSRLAGPLHLVAVGKAAGPMMRTALRTCGSQVGHALVVSSQAEASDIRFPKPIWQQAGNPVPDDRSARAGRDARLLAASVGVDETLVVLLSGGASALMALPADGITLADKMQTTHALLRAGADIQSLNTVRKHLSAIKGGRLAAACRGATLAFAVSDVVGDDLTVIGSGPTVPDPSTFGDALDVIARLGPRVPHAAIEWLKTGARGEVPETPKPGDSTLARASTWLAGSIADAIAAAAAAAKSRGYSVATIREPIVGEARDAGRAHAGRVRIAAAGLTPPLCIISGGETTVTVTGEGQGGRNQEFMLAAAEPLVSLAGRVAAASVGTDGIDGPTDAAGAMIDGSTLDRWRSAGVDPGDALARNDAYPAFDRIGDLIRMGPTATNVGDLQIVLLE